MHTFIYIFFSDAGYKRIVAVLQMPTKDSWCKKLCAKCNRPKLRKDDPLKPTPTESKSKIHWLVVFATFCALGAWVIPEVQRANEDDMLSYFPAKLAALKRKPRAITISGVDFVSDVIRDKTQELAYHMVSACVERSDDVIFAFQFGNKKKQRRREDHIFSLCGNETVPTRVYGNAVLIGSSEDFVLCTEEYDGELRRVQRHASVSIKAIDIVSWETMEYDVDDVKEACVVQHAIDVLESRWI